MILIFTNWSSFFHFHNFSHFFYVSADVRLHTLVLRKKKRKKAKTARNKKNNGLKQKCDHEYDQNRNIGPKLLFPIIHYAY